MKINFYLLLLSLFLTGSIQAANIDFRDFDSVSKLIDNLPRLNQTNLLVVADNYEAIERTLLVEQTRILKKDREELANGEAGHVLALFIAHYRINLDAARNAAWSDV